MSKKSDVGSPTEFTEFIPREGEYGFEAYKKLLQTEGNPLLWEGPVQLDAYQSLSVDGEIPGVEAGTRFITAVFQYTNPKTGTRVTTPKVGWFVRPT